MWLLRLFSTSNVLLVRKVKPRPAPTKAKLAAKERKKALKARKNIYEHEKMTLANAIDVLRVSYPQSFPFLPLTAICRSGQAVEVSRPNSTYELTIKTAMGRGMAIPKGRINLPREAKTKTKDRVFVFAEGRQAEEAKRAGAEFVGGTELIDAVGACNFVSSTPF